MQQTAKNETLYYFNFWFDFMLAAVRMLWIWGNTLKAVPRHIRTSN
jgi:hypothetical protein